MALARLSNSALWNGQGKGELDLVGGGESAEAPSAAGPRPSFPSDDFAQTAAVMSALASASAPLDAAAIAATFKQGRKVAPKVGAVLAALARTGFVTTADGGATFSLRRAAWSGLWAIRSPCAYLFRRAIRRAFASLTE